MPSLEHDALVDMFRGNPPLAAHLLESLFHVDLPRYTSVAVAESSLDSLVPVAFQADLVLELRDASTALAMSIILEVQRAKDPEKKYSWPVYVAVERSKKRSPACVLVIALDADVAAWASEPIDLGLRISTTTALVLGPGVVPRVTDPKRAEQEPDLAVLSALAHGNGPDGLDTLLAAMAALCRLPTNRAAIYFHIVYNALRDPIKKAFEVLVMQQETLDNLVWPPFIQKLIDEGELKGRREVLFRLLGKLGLKPSADDHTRIQACEDPALLDRWIDSIIGAKTIDDVFR